MRKRTKWELTKWKVDQMEIDKVGIDKVVINPYSVLYAHTGATHFTVAITHVYRLNNFLYQECDVRMDCACTFLLPEAPGNHRDNERSMRANLYIVPSQLRMAICYQYESVYFPAPYADNQLLCSLCRPKRGHAMNSAGFKHNN